MNFDLFTALFFPRRCLGCRKNMRAGVLCDACRATITISRTLFCGQCGIPAHYGKAGGARSFCHPSFPYLLGAASSYENETLKALIHSLKFRNMTAAAEPLASILFEYTSVLGLDLDEFTAMPIPLSRERFRARGFNQSERIARFFALRLGLPLETNWLARVRHAKPQSETRSLAERKENIRGCFAAMDRAAVQGKKIILIDDVSTSGATFMEAATALRAAGAAEIIALAVAKT